MKNVQLKPVDEGIATITKDHHWNIDRSNIVAVGI
jgi:hypothetical protein